MSMREDIVGFLPEPGAEHPFRLEMAGISYCDGSYRIRRTASQVYVIEYILRGQGTVFAGGGRFTARRGDIYLLHRGADHLYYSDAEDPWVKVWMNFSGPLADSLLFHYRLGNLSHVSGLDISPLLMELLDAAREAQNGFGDIHFRAAVLFHSIVQQIYTHTQKAPEPASGPAKDLKAWLDNHIYLKTTVEELARQIYRSPAQAIRIFRSEYGVTPYEYLLGKRIETAKLLLKNTSLPVMEIADRLQFADGHYFSNFFKKRVGVSPAEFRKTV